MKKTIILLLVLLPALIFADAKNWWYGGAARMLSLGGVTTTLPDYSNAYDLYSSGFPTALLWRDKKDVVDLTPMYNIGDLTGDKKWNEFGALNNFISCWIGDNDAIVLKPDYNKEDNREGGGLAGYDNSMNNYDLNGDIEYMHKLASDTGFSISVFSTNSSDISSDNAVLPLYSTNADSNYSEKDVGANLGIDKHLGDLQIPYISDFLPRLDLAAAAGYKVKNIYNTGYLNDPSIVTYTASSLEKESDKLVNVNLGLVFTSPGKKSNLVFNIAKYFVVNSSYYYNSGTSTSAGAVIDETRVDLNAKLDYYITDYLLGSARVQWMDPDYKIAAGVALVTDVINIPLEYFKNDINGHVESYGGGIECNLLKLAGVRLGARRYSYDENRIDYTAGLGIETNNFLCDIGMDYATNKEAWTRTDLLADIKAVW
jgi:hypothetical protein